ncbi:aldehyde dehydrogenase family protein [Sphingobium chungangianum]
MTELFARYGHFIDGSWRAAADYAPNINPSDLGDIVCEYALADTASAEEAVDAADRAFSDWSRSSIQQRSDILEQAASLIFAERAAIATVLAREEGKTLAEALGETVRAGQIFRFFAGEALRIPGYLGASVRPGIRVEVTREPVGVVALIAPWNFPIAIPAWKAAAALCYGNSVVLKPSEFAPATSCLLADILARAGLPKGVFNLVNGRGGAGAAIVGAPAVRAISFTGSVATGNAILAVAAAAGKKVQLEMGGKNPLVILADADLEVAVDAALQGAFGSTGQRCTASSRLIVEDAIHDAFVDRLAERLVAFRVGPALDEASCMGPIATAPQCEKVEQAIAQALGDGARIAFGGNRLGAAPNGYFFEPTLFVDTHPEMALNRREIFGPVASVLRARDYDEALHLANDTEFGLCAGIATRSLARAEHFKRSAAAGMVMVNLPTAGVDYHVPFGGTKGSSYGPREQGTAACEFYTQVKTAYVRAET